MPDPAEPVRAPQGAIAWTPTDGWVYDAADLPARIEDDHFVLVVSERDGMMRGVTAFTSTPLVATLRIDADLSELVLRVADLAEELAAALNRLDALAGGGAS
jgi:hypothetical protein